MSCHTLEQPEPEELVAVVPARPNICSGWRLQIAGVSRQTKAITALVDCLRSHVNICPCVLFRHKLKDSFIH